MNHPPVSLSYYIPHHSNRHCSRCTSPFHHQMRYHIPRHIDFQHTISCTDMSFPVIYQLHCLISPDTIGCDSSFFYHCTECDGHIYQCNCLRNSEFVQSKPKTEREIENAIICPKCGGKIQKLGAGVLFCLDCDWETGFNPDEELSS